nr:MAG TPA: hypothetical protein [Caudoviricetes sp.]
MTDWLEVVVVTALVANALLVIALLMMLNNAAWDGTLIAEWATRTNAATTVNTGTVGGLAIRPIVP